VGVGGLSALIGALWGCQAGVEDTAARAEMADSADTPDTSDSSDTSDTASPSWYVCPSVGDFDSVQAALDGTEGALDVLVCPSQFFENLVIVDRAVRIVSTAGGNTTWLDGQRQGPVITVMGAGALVLDGVSLMNGEGGAIVSDGAVTLDAGWFYDNAGPVISAVSVTVTDTHFRDNANVAIAAESAQLSGVNVKGQGFAVADLYATTTLWEGTGDFTSGALTAENLTLVQLGSGRIAESGSILNSIVSGPFLPSAPLLLWTDVDGSDQVLGTGSFAADPVFAETETYTLSPMSPCIDAGSGVDADGSVRDLGWLPRG
jgi:hypothetical protein